ncbi:unnamed protein product [Ectocarpus sp. 12 AP-2014]
MVVCATVGATVQWFGIEPRRDKACLRPLRLKRVTHGKKSKDVEVRVLAVCSTTFTHKRPTVWCTMLSCLTYSWRYISLLGMYARTRPADITPEEVQPELVVLH